MADKVFTETINDPTAANSVAGVATRLADGEAIFLQNDPVTGRVKIIYTFSQLGKIKVVEQSFVVGAGTQPETRVLQLITSARAAVW